MMLDSWLSLPAGILIATTVSTVGIGGGILWMPFLVIILRCRPDTAVVTSLLNCLRKVGSSNRRYAKVRLSDPGEVDQPGPSARRWRSHRVDLEYSTIGCDRDVESATRAIGGRFEPILRRIFEEDVVTS